VNRLGPDYFERMYGEDPDPWGFDTRWYERRKYDLTLAALPRTRYRSAFEPGCSNGALTERLAARCERLLATDLLDQVAERARARLAELPSVEVRSVAIPDDWPPGPFDLVVLSEVAYYLTPEGLDETLDRVAATLEPGGHLVAVHWRGETDYPQRGDEVHQTIDARPELVRLSRYQEDDFVLDVHERGRAPGSGRGS